MGGGVAAAQKSCRDWIKQTIVFIVHLFYCFVSIVSRSVVSIQLIRSSESYYMTHRWCNVYHAKFVEGGKGCVTSLK